MMPGGTEIEPLADFICTLFRWTVPQRAVRSAVKKIAQQFTTNSSYLIKYLAAVSSSSRRILNFVATCVSLFGLEGLDDLINQGSRCELANPS